MDENRISGTAKNIGGKVEEDFGRVTGDAKTEAAGVAKQMTGAAQDMYGQARDAVSDMSDAARGSASSFEKVLRGTIENSAVHGRLCRAWNWLVIGPNAPPVVGDDVID